MLGKNDQVRFELSSDKFNPIEVQEPVNWDSDDKSYEIDTKLRGTLIKNNTKLQLGQDSYDKIKGALLSNGFDSKIWITKTAKDRTHEKEKWRKVYEANLDLLAATFTEKLGYNRVEVPFKQGGLYDDVYARWSDAYDLVSTVSADNEPITELNTITEDVTGREIFRRSELYVEDEVRTEMTFRGGDRDAAEAIPFQVKINSDSDFINPITSGAGSVPYSSGNYATGNVGSMLYDRSDRDKILVLKGDIKIRMIDTEDGTLSLEMVYYKTVGDDLVPQPDMTQVLSTMDSGQTLNELVYNFDDVPITIPEDHSLAIVARVRIDSYIIGPKELKYDYLGTDLTIKIDDKYPPTRALALLPFEMFDRLLEKITGEKGLLISNVFGRKDLGYAQDGEWSTLAISSGFWARGFDLLGQTQDANGEDIPLKQLSISLNDAFESFGVILPLMAGVVNVNGKEFFRIEKYEYTQQTFRGVRLGRQKDSGFEYIPVSNSQTTLLTENMYTSLKFGYEKGGKDYEEVNGLWSPHGIASYNTCLKDVPNEYAKVSVFRADLEAYEIARTKQADFNPDEDTAYDQDIFFRHLIKNGSAWRMRLWSDDLESLPTGNGIYSPKTMGNFLLTPFRCMLRHKGIIATGLYPQPYENVTFISSNCYSDLTTKVSGQDSVKENGSIQNRELGKPYINGWLLTCEAKVFQDTIDQLEGTTNINGDEVPNFYGEYEFMFNGQLTRGKVIKVSINGSGKHEIALI